MAGQRNKGKAKGKYADTVLTPRTDFPMRASLIETLEPQMQARWDRHDPTYLVTCKVQRVDPPLAVAFRAEYGKQGPWVEIDEDLPPVSFEEVVPHNDYLKVAIDVKKALAELQKNPMEKPAPEAPPAAAAAATAKPDAGTPTETAS